MKQKHNGEKLKINAKDYNAIVDTVNRSRQQMFNTQTPRSSPLPLNMCYVWNQSGVDVDVRNILGISGCYPNYTWPNFNSQLILTGVLPLIPDHTHSKFVITAEPIKNNAVGLAYISGIAPAVVNIPYESGGNYLSKFKYAEITNGDASILQGCKGIASLMIIFLDTNGDWEHPSHYNCLVRFGDNEPTIRRAKCTEAANTDKLVTANLYRNGVEQTTGSESDITVNCEIFGGETQLQYTMPKLLVGDIIFVTNIDGQWYCINTFTSYVSCECEEGAV